jgi:hypothetical protein
MLDKGTLFFSDSADQGLNAFMKTSSNFVVESNPQNPVFGSRLSETGVENYYRVMFRYAQIASDADNPSNKKELTELFDTISSVATLGTRAFEEEPGTMYALTAALGGLRTNSNNADLVKILGIDDLRQKLMLNLLDMSLDMSNTEFSPDPENLDSQQAFRKASEQTFASFKAASIGTSAIDTASVIVDGRQEKPAEVVNLVRSWSKGNIDGKIADKYLQGILKTLRMSEEGFYEAIVSGTGNTVLPAFKDTINGAVFKVETPTGPEFKAWKNMTFADKVQYALTNTQNATILPKLASPALIPPVLT